MYLVIQQIFSYLPTSDLASVRQCSSYLSLYATSNHLWQSRCQALWRRYVTLQDCRAIPAKLWSFSCVPNGWFRAYITIIRIARDDWLTCDDDLKRNVFMVFFKSHLGDNVGAEHWHALVKFEEDGMVHPIDGLPLYSNVWSVDEMKTLRGKLCPRRLAISLY